MKIELKAKFLQHLNQKKQDEGFTLIELLVVIIIIGILSAIALPSFLNQANKAKQSEAKQYVGSMNRAQQSFYLEKGRWVTNDKTDFGNLGLGIATQTTNYKYVIAGKETDDVITNQAQQVKPKAPLKAYTGGVAIGTQEGTGEATTLAILCEAKEALVQNNALDGKAVVAPPAAGKQPECPTNYDPLS
ncbi:MULTISPECIES: type IV pilin-like G/H family protein [unclassified Coleofasciculus]|uniref:type IV pilin-like G/H family protein n=1 Tax=unclassified Coleofasciculus TaxID=2692782 RepID=UPI00187FC513|nr:MULTISPECIES: type IV pilin-like G/H family protein [unclassified Coleofasciculus]MBE9125455.1 type IV pilin-like G/H family protein [Coleofasciculus sp. LEGE 07081]MBE9147141.1 type IV pilin-like G/H family protein [Coleofasciculus sp. LEGE 07092]